MPTSKKQIAQFKARENSKYRARLLRQQIHSSSSPAGYEVDSKDIERSILTASVDRLQSLLPSSSQWRNQQKPKSLLLPDKPLSNPSKLILGIPAAKVHVSWMPVGEQDIGRSKAVLAAALISSDDSGNGSSSNYSGSSKRERMLSDGDDTKPRTQGQGADRNKLPARSQFSPALDAEIWQFARYVALSEQEIQSRRVVLEDVGEALRAKFPDAAVNAFGSFASAMSIFSSDVDVSVEGLGAEIDEEGQFCVQDGRTTEEVDAEHEEEEEEEERREAAVMSAGHKRKAIAISEKNSASADEAEDSDSVPTVGWMLDTSGDKPRDAAPAPAPAPAPAGERATVTGTKNIGILARGQAVEPKSSSSAEIELHEREWHGQTNNNHHTLRANLSRKITKSLMDMNPQAPRAWFEGLRELAAEAENNLYHAANTCAEYSDAATLKRRIQLLTERGVVWRKPAPTAVANVARGGQLAGNAQDVREALLESIGRNLVRLRRLEQQCDAAAAPASSSGEDSSSNSQQLDADVQLFLEVNDRLLGEVEACRAMDQHLRDLVAEKSLVQVEGHSAAAPASASASTSASSLAPASTGTNLAAAAAVMRSGMVVIDTGTTTIKSRSIADKNNSLYQTLYNSDNSPPSDSSDNSGSTASSEGDAAQRTRRRGREEEDEEDEEDDDESDNREKYESASDNSGADDARHGTYDYDDDDDDSSDDADDDAGADDDDDDLDIGIHGAEYLSDDSDGRGRTSSQFSLQLQTQQRAADKKQQLERRRHQQETLRAIYAHLQRMGWNDVSELRSRARVPIIALLHRSGINCDISLGVQGGSLTTVVRDLISAGRDAFYPLTAFLKVFLGQLNLDKPFNGGIGSYKLYVMVAYLLNCFQAQTLCKPRVDLGYLLVAFLTYFGKQENLNQYTELKVCGAAVDFRHNGLVVACQKAFQKACDILKKAVVSPAQFASAKERQKMSSSLLALVIDSQKLQRSRSQHTENATTALLQHPPDRQARERVATEILGFLCRKLSAGGGIVPRITLEQVKETNSALAARLMSFLSVRDAVSHLAGGGGESGSSNHHFASKGKGKPKAKAGGRPGSESGRSHSHGHPNKRPRVHPHSDDSSGGSSNRSRSGGGRKGVAHFAPMGVTGAAFKATPRSGNAGTPDGARRERELRAVLLAAKAKKQQQH